MINFRGIFGGNSVEELTEKLTNAGRMTTIALPGNIITGNDMSNKDAIYMVGINEDGMTQIKVGYPTSITLTLNNAGVAHLIKQLAVNIDDDYEVKVTRIEYEGE